MFISDFRYHRPQTVQDACQILEGCENGVVLAGGTDLLVDLKQRKRFHDDVISVSGIAEMRGIRLQDKRLLIGANVTHGELAASPLLREHNPAICETAEAIGTEQIRNNATVGGNLCTAASCADTAPILFVLSADVELASLGKKRTLPLEKFFVGHRQTALDTGEILTTIFVPLPPMGTGAAFAKFGLRGAANISVASVAAKVQISRGICVDACFVMGAVAPTPKISPAAAGLVVGKPLTELANNGSLLKRIGDAVANDSEPIGDLRGSADYRRQITAVLAQRAFTKALRRASKYHDDESRATG